MNSIGIGTLAKRAGVSIDTIRYYEKSGLLPPEARLPSGYRRYTAEQVSRGRFSSVAPRNWDSRSRTSANSWDYRSSATWQR